MTVWSHRDRLLARRQLKMQVQMKEPLQSWLSGTFRLKGHKEFISLLKYCVEEPLIREAPLSIEAAAVDAVDPAVLLVKSRPGAKACLV